MSTHTTERTTTLAAARTIVDRAKAADRELTPAEQAEVEQHIAHVKNLDRKVASGQLVDRVMALGGVGREPDPEASGDLFSEDAKAGIVHATKTRTAYRTEVDAKAALTTGTMLPTVGVGRASRACTRPGCSRCPRCSARRPRPRPCRPVLSHGCGKRCGRGGRGLEAGRRT